MDDLRRCFEILGLSPEADPEEVRQAFRDLANVWHPDRFVHNRRLQRRAEEVFKEVNTAYAQLRRYFASPEYREAISGGVRPEWSLQPARPLHASVPPPKWVEQPATTALVSAALGFVLAGAVIALLAALAPSVGSTRSMARAPRNLGLTSKAQEQPSERAGAVAQLANQGYFTIGSSKSQVHGVQGKPSSVTGNIWWFGNSYVSFSFDRVVGYDDAAGELNVVLLFEPPSAAGEGFRVGSTRDHVLASQGTPTSITGEIWWYGGSFIQFRFGRVSHYSDAGNLHLRN